MPRAKMILMDLKSGSAMKQGGSYIYNGTALSSIFPKGTEVIGRPSYSYHYAYIRNIDGSRREFQVYRKDLQEYIKVKPEKYLVTKKAQVMEMFACGEKDAKETARKMLKMQRLTKVQVTKIGAYSDWSMFMPGVIVRVTQGDFEGREMVIIYKYYEGYFMCSDSVAGRSYVINEDNLVRI